MKKLISLVLAMALICFLGTAAFADNDTINETIDGDFIDSNGDGGSLELDSAGGNVVVTDPYDNDGTYDRYYAIFLTDGETVTDEGNHSATATGTGELASVTGILAASANTDVQIGGDAVANGTAACAVASYKYANVTVGGNALATGSFDDTTGDNPRTIAVEATDGGVVTVKDNAEARGCNTRALSAMNGGKITVNGQVYAGGTNSSNGVEAYCGSEVIVHGYVLAENNFDRDFIPTALVVNGSTVLVGREANGSASMYVEGPSFVVVEGTVTGNIYVAPDSDGYSPGGEGYGEGEGTYDPPQAYVGAVNRDYTSGEEMLTGYLVGLASGNITEYFDFFKNDAVSSDIIDHTASGKEYYWADSFRATDGAEQPETKTVLLKLKDSVKDELVSLTGFGGIQMLEDGRTFALTYDLTGGMNRLVLKFREVENPVSGAIVAVIKPYRVESAGKNSISMKYVPGSGISVTEEKIMNTCVSVDGKELGEDDCKIVFDESTEDFDINFSSALASYLSAGTHNVRIVVLGFVYDVHITV